MSGPAKDDDDLYRLRDLKVEEVSIVDRPANRIEWLIVKRDGEDPMSAGPEVREGADGKLTVAKADPAKPEDEAAKAKVPPEDEAAKAKAPKPEDAEKAGGRLEAGAREAAERLLSLANQAKGKAPDAAMLRELKAVSGLLTGLADKYPSPKAGVAKAEADLIAEGRTFDGVLHTAAQAILGGSREQAAAAVAGVRAAIDYAVGKAAKVEDEEPEDEAKAKAAKPKDLPGAGKRFTAERVGKLTSALGSLLDVLKDLGVTNLPALLNVAKSDGTAEGEVIAKALSAVGVDAEAARAAEADGKLADLQKRLDRLETAGLAKGLGGDAVAKAVKPDLWKGIV